MIITTIIHLVVLLPHQTMLMDCFDGHITIKIFLLDKTFNKKLLSKSTLFSLKHSRDTSYPLAWPLLPVQMRTVQHNTSQSKATLLAHQHHPATTANLLQTSFHPLRLQSFVFASFHHPPTKLCFANCNTTIAATMPINAQQQQHAQPQLDPCSNNNGGATTTPTSPSPHSTDSTPISESMHEELF